MNNEDYFKGRGAQIKPQNPFSKQGYGQIHHEGLDEELLSKPSTQFFSESPKQIINKIESPDLSIQYSINPYQGCEHGCIYCYARNSHTYWGFDAGLDFESKIIVKPNAPELLGKAFRKKSWKPAPIMVSGNTDCYQPAERKLQITRKLLEVFLRFKNPVGIITKNSLIKRDIDILGEMAKYNLVHVYFSVTTLDEKLRTVMEPRTASGQKRLDTMAFLSDQGIPTGVMTAPIIPALNSAEIPELLKRASEAGARTAGYTVVRLNGQDGEIFRNWLEKNFPDRAVKVWNQISELHGGKVNDPEFGRRITGEGNQAVLIKRMFELHKNKHFSGRQMPDYDLSHFRNSGEPMLFD